MLNDYDLFYSDLNTQTFTVKSKNNNNLETMA